MTDGNNSKYLPVQSDFLIAYSTTLGFMSRFLLETLNGLNGNNDLLTSLSIAESVQQNPTITHTLRGLVKFTNRNKLLESMTIISDSSELGEQQLKTKDYFSRETNPQAQLFRLDEENFDNIRDYINRFIALISTINANGEPLCDNLKRSALLCGLPKSLPAMKEFKDYIVRKYPSKAEYKLVLEELIAVSEKESSHADIHLPSISDPHESGCKRSTPLETKEQFHHTEDNSDDLTVDDPSFPQHGEDQKYKMEAMNNDPIGLALVIANKTFKIELGLEDRLCYEMDLFLIGETFTKLGFDLILCLDKNKKEIKTFLNDVCIKMNPNINCLAVIVSSHGSSNGMIYAKDGIGFKHMKSIKVANDDVPYHSKMQTDMGGRTKSFSQSTKKKRKRGTPILDHELPWPDIEDHFLVLFSTVKDHVAFRDDKGSWFTKSLCKILNREREHNIQHILTSVNYESAFMATSDSAQISQATTLHTVTSLSVSHHEVFQIKELHMFSIEVGTTACQMSAVKVYIDLMRPNKPRCALGQSISHSGLFPPSKNFPLSIQSQMLSRNLMVPIDQ
ncbi:hypothetical protein FOCC_FOCC002055 [Frankliniella occidentalis]|nr:hypothetical protein FOCC_FOCC002055 [Frankliniella occidentalis]